MTRDNDALSFDALVESARQAGPEDRIQFRDAIAAYGLTALPTMTSWLREPQLGAFAVRVLDKIVPTAGAPRVLAALEANLKDLPTAAVARDVSDLAARLQRRVDDMAEAEGFAEESRRRTEEDRARVEAERELAMTFAKRLAEAKTWLAGQVSGDGVDAPAEGDADLLVKYLDRVDTLRRTQGAESLQGEARKRAAESWLRARLRPDDEKRVSVCWNCLSTVFSDTNPRCPDCGWLVCSCDACKEPLRFGSPCPRTAGRRFGDHR